MHPPTPSPLSCPSAQPADQLVTPVLWNAVIEGDPEPALLSRLMQKLICQGATIRTLRYEHPEHASSVQIKVVFAAETTRARLLAKQWQTIIAVSAVRLQPLGET